MQINSIGAQVNGLDAHEATRYAIMDLRNRVISFPVGEYLVGISELAFILRIDGALGAWGKSGVGQITISYSKQYISIEIYVPESVWRDCSTEIIRERLAHLLSEGWIAGTKKVFKRQPARVHHDAISAFNKIIFE